MKKYQIKITIIMAVFLLLSILIVLPAFGESSRLHCYTRDSRFFSPNQTYRPEIRIYATNLNHLEVTVYELNSFKIKDGNFHYNSESPEISGKVVFRRDLNFSKYDYVKKRKYKDKYFNLKSFQTRNSSNKLEGTFKPPASKTGIYLVRIQSGKHKYDVTLVASPLSMIVKYSPDFVEGFLYDQKTDRPASGVSVKLFDSRGFRYMGVTDKNGWFRFSTKKDLKGPISVLAHKGKAYCIYSFRTKKQSKRDYVYVYTDRPIYRPGQTVYFKGIISDIQKDKKQKLIENKSITINLRDAKYSTIKTLKLKTSDNGSFDGKFQIANDAPLGRYTIITGVDKKNYYSSFQIHEYKKPEFEVFVKPGKDIVLKGEEVKVAVRARYYFGNPVKGGNLKYRITSNPDPLRIPGRYYPGYGRHDIVVTSGKAKLDNIGRATFTIKTDPDMKQDSTYIIECGVRDKLNRTINGHGAFHVRVSGKRVAVSVKPNYVSKNEKMEINLLTTDMFNKPVSSDVEVILNQQIWNRKTRKYESREIQKLNVKTGKDGKAERKIVPEKPGYIKVTAKVIDNNGLANSGNTRVWVSGYKSYAYNYPTLEMIMDKKVYSPGDTAKILINSSYTGMLLYVTLEQNRIYKRWLLPATGNSTTFEVPIEKDYAPGVYFKVCFVSKGVFRSGQKFLNVPVTDKFLDIEINSDRGIYKPGETAIYSIKTKDQDGKPVSAELSMGVVDDAIYALAPDRAADIRKFFYGRRPNRIYTGYSVPREYPGGSYQKVAPKKVIVPEKMVRKNFKDTTFWAPRIFTDKEGLAKVKVELADNLTRWRTTIKGYTHDMKVGSVKQKVIARKDMTIRLAVPRFFRYKDCITVSSIISNDSKKDQEVKISFDIRGANIKGEHGNNHREETLVIKAGEEKKFDYPLIMKPYPPGKKITIKAVAEAKSGLFDGVERTFPVEPFGKFERNFLTKTVRESFREEVKIPDDTIMGASELVLRISPSIASNIMGSLDYMAKYPYGCVEQTMSRFLPLCVLRDTLDSLEIKNDDLNKKMPDMVKKGFRKLYGYQHSDGGWGWWKSDKIKPLMTAYVIFGFHWAEKAGYKVQPRVLERGIKSLMILTKSEKDLGKKSFMLYSLSVYGKANKDMAQAIYKKKDKLNSYGLALLALTLDNLNEKEKLSAVISDIENKAIADENYVHWEGSKGYGWMSSDIEATAWVLYSLLKAKPESGLIQKTISWLLMKKNGDHWVCTKTTGYVIMALSEYLKKSGELDVDMTAKIKVNGREVESLKFDRKSAFENEKVVKIPGIHPKKGYGLKKGDNKIVIEKEGKGVLHVSRSLDLCLDREPVKEDNENFGIIKTYFVKNEEGKWVPLNRSIRSGEEVVAEIKVIPKKSFSYVMLTDPLPSGFEVKKIRRLRDYYFTNAEKRDNRVVFFRSYMWKNSKGIIFSYVMLAERPGELNVMPPRVELMYRPDVKCEGEAFMLDVSGKE
ncbi:MAG: hypothetical protein K8T10_17795 [Candidatus Eremiobacteraeota bacterium]|nr:hypothetical protein [Candidatus Eremiobacteraeota bacterium]